MAEQTPRSPRERLPIKLILPKQGQKKKVLGGGKAPEPFRTVDSAYRGRLVNQVAAISETLDARRATQVRTAPVRVKILNKAAAKSHRPEHLFSELTCPIIGGGQLGELFVKATPDGLARLAAMVQNNSTDRINKELSCVETIEAVTPLLRRHNQEPAEILRRSPRRSNGFITRVNLFTYGDADDAGLVKDFKDTCAKQGIRLDQRGYSPASQTYAAECRSVADIEALSRIVGVRSIRHMPLVRTIRPRVLAQQQPLTLPARDPNNTDLPVVVVVDSGITTSNPALNSWVVGRKNDVAKPYDQNTDHGTFVAGLICFGKELNPTLAGVGEGDCAVFDLQVIPNDDPARGETSALLEIELLSSLEEALKLHAKTYKVWNLSLGSSEVCSLDEFSQLAQELDNLQEKYQVSFVISAGNYDIAPLLDYPRTPAQLEHGRITSPADSVLGITVGSVSHVDFKNNGPKHHQPSPFSRHGAGPNYIIKPDLVHYGGSCSTDTAHVHGVRSLTEAGLAEDLGTSFSTPLVSRTLAQIYHQVTPTPSPVLARALLTHHARDPRSGQRVPDGEENFLGFGLPTVAPYCLECSPHSATLVFEEALSPGYFMEWDDFPYPVSLKQDGRYFGEVSMTLAFAPSRGGRWAVGD